MVNLVCNEAFKRLNKINNPRYRDKNSDTFDVIIEGERIISQVISYGIKIKNIYIAMNKINPSVGNAFIRSASGNSVGNAFIRSALGNKASLFPEASAINAFPTDGQVFYLSEKQSSILSETKNEQGIYAQIEFKTKSILKENRLLYLNNISDPGNLGAIIRTAASFPIDGVLIDEKCCDLANSKAIRASMGAVFDVPIMKVNSDWLEQNEHQIIVSDVHNGTSLNNFLFPKQPYVLVMGSEATGVSESIQRLAHQRVYIPLSGGMESLNVAVATGIFLYKMSAE